tara:strand:- start:252 stop:641 length:390 start_codon:yes stop_codon:yes gene_type:complete
MTLAEQIIQMGMVHGMGKRNFPMFNLLNAAREQEMITTGLAIIGSDAFGQQVLLPGPNAQQPPALPPTPPAAQVAETTESIQAVKAEINKTQGRALSTVESGIRTDMQAGFAELKALIVGNQAPPEIPA